MNNLTVEAAHPITIEDGAYQIDLRFLFYVDSHSYIVAYVRIFWWKELPSPTDWQFLSPTYELNLPKEMRLKINKVMKQFIYGALSA